MRRSIASTALNRIRSSSLLTIRDYVDWHYDRVGVPKERHDRLQAELAKLGIPITSMTNGLFLGVRV
jgi:hypothetical protein